MNVTCICPEPCRLEALEKGFGAIYAPVFEVFRSDIWKQIMTSTRSMDDRAKVAHAHVAPVQAHTFDRVDMLEALVYQLSEQNGALKRNMLETRFVSWVARVGASLRPQPAWPRTNASYLHRKPFSISSPTIQYYQT